MEKCDVQKLVDVKSDRLSFEINKCYVDAAYCYRLSSVVCWSVSLSVCHSSEPCKNGWTDRDAVWVEDSGGPKEPRIWCRSASPHGKGQFWGGRAAHWVYVRI